MFQAFDDIMDHSDVHCIFPKLALGVKHATFFRNGPNYMVCSSVGCSHKGFFIVVYRVLLVPCNWIYQGEVYISCCGPYQRA